MTEPNYSVGFTALMAASSACSLGNALVFDATSGYWVVATAANRTALGKRAEAVALSAYGGSAVGKVAYQVTGILAQSVSGLSTGAASKQLVRVSSTGTLERVASADPETDDIVGYAETDGRVHLCIGFPFAEVIALAGGGVNASHGQLVFWNTDAAPDELTGAEGLVCAKGAAGSGEDDNEIEHYGAPRHYQEDTDHEEYVDLEAGLGVHRTRWRSVQVPANSTATLMDLVIPLSLGDGAITVTVETTLSYDDGGPVSLSLTSKALFTRSGSGSTLTRDAIVDMSDENLAGNGFGHELDVGIVEGDASKIRVTVKTNADETEGPITNVIGAALVQFVGVPS